MVRLVLAAVVGLALSVAFGREEVPLEEEPSSGIETGASSRGDSFKQESLYVETDRFERLLDISRNPDLMANGVSISQLEGGRRLLGHNLDQCICDWCEENCPVCPPVCPGEDWTCGDPIEECGESRDGMWKCVCDIDVHGKEACWQDDFCAGRPMCAQNSDCLASEVCVTNCCPPQTRGRCFKKCEKPKECGTTTTTRCPGPCHGKGDWECGARLIPCGDPQCYCDLDIDGHEVCWKNDWCNQLITCRSNRQCPPGTHCVPDTCCGIPKCIPDCPKPYDA